MTYEPITDEEVAAAEEVFLPTGACFNGQRRQVITCMETKDIKAAPGSGKTTALLAKLFILAQRMPFKDRRGICVLTHTNVAIDEIKSRLGSKADVLFAYPNFFGTFQSFVDKYLAIPYYALATKSRAITIDEEYYEEKIKKQVMGNIRGVKTETLKNARYFLLSSKIDISKIRIKSDEKKRFLTVGMNGKKIDVKRPRKGKLPDFSEEQKEAILDWFIRVRRKTLSDGVLCYDDAYLLANHYIERYGSQLKDLFSHRFSFVFVDEAQDTYSHQSSIIESIFDDRVVVQKFGDPHQSIFGSKESEEALVWVPNDSDCLKISDSQRFGIRIAQKLRKICVDENHELHGSATVPSLKPHIILFNNDEATSVLERFAELVYEYNLHMQDERGKIGTFKAIGWRGNSTDNIIEKPCLNTYWSFYNRKAAKLKAMYHDNLKSYIKKVPQDAAVQNSPKVYYDAIINAIVRFLYLADVRDTTSGRLRHFHRSSLLRYLKESHENDYLQLQKNISEWALAIQSEEEIYNTAVFEALRHYLVNDVKRLWPQIALNKLKDFLESSAEADTQEQDVNVVGNEYVSTSHPEIKISINTVHAVKGETHRATLYLETFNYERDLKKLLPFLQGEFNANLAKQKRVQDALKIAYVGMSRPTHLLCLALNRDGISKEDIEKLSQNGWEIVQAKGVERKKLAAVATSVIEAADKN